LCDGFGFGVGVGVDDSRGGGRGWGRKSVFEGLGEDYIAILWEGLLAMDSFRKGVWRDGEMGAGIIWRLGNM